LFASGRHDDLNVRGAYLHMMADAAVSLGVVIAAVAVMATGWLWIDPLVSIVIALVIAWGTWSLLAESTQLAVDGVPHGVDLTAIGQFLKAQPGVSDVHDLHVWALSTTSTALTAHLVRPDHDGNDAFLSATADALKQAHGISHVTLQIENQPGCTACCQFKAMANSDDDHHEGCGHDHHDHGHL
jgi:cobalt-zinc-cadmium efflux system protein